MEAAIVRSILIAILAALAGQATLAAASSDVNAVPRIDTTLSVILPEGTPDAEERRLELDRLLKDQGFLLTEEHRQAQLMARLAEDLRSVEGERTGLLATAGALASTLAAIALVLLVRARLAAQRRKPGSWYRPGVPTRHVKKAVPLALPAPVRKPVSQPPVGWTEEDWAATRPLVREFGRR